MRGEFVKNSRQDVHRHITTIQIASARLGRTEKTLVVVDVLHSQSGLDAHLGTVSTQRERTNERFRVGEWFYLHDGEESGRARGL